MLSRRLPSTFPLELIFPCLVAIVLITEMPIGITTDMKDPKIAREIGTVIGEVALEATTRERLEASQISIAIRLQ